MITYDILRIALIRNLFVSHTLGHSSPSAGNLVVTRKSGPRIGQSTVLDIDYIYPHSIKPWSAGSLAINIVSRLITALVSSHNCFIHAPAFWDVSGQEQLRGCWKIISVLFSQPGGSPIAFQPAERGDKNFSQEVRFCLTKKGRKTKRP